jgi:hypothetical protein
MHNPISSSGKDFHWLQTYIKKNKPNIDATPNAKNSNPRNKEATACR